MTTIKNLLNQPITLHKSDGTGLHIGPRERITFNEAPSKEMITAASKSIISLGTVSGEKTDTPIATGNRQTKRK